MSMQKLSLKHADLAKKTRPDFPILSRKVHEKPLVYLDSAATTQKPKQVIEAMNFYYKNYNANVHRGIHKLSEEASLMYEGAHRKVAEFIGASGIEEIIFTKNTTESINLLAYTLTKNLKPGDEIIISQMEHHSNFVPWQQIAKDRKLTLKFIEIDSEGKLKLDSLKKLLTNKTKIVSITHVSNVLGTINPIKEMARLAHEKGALFVVDGAQSVPHMPINVRDLDCDFFAFSGHKMLGPTGIGVLYGKKHLLEKLPPFLTGGGTIREVRFDDSTWEKLPWKFEAGTPPIAEAAGLAAAIDYLQSIGMEKIRSHEIELTKYALKKMATVPGIVVYGPKKAEDRGGVISFNLGSIHSHDLSTLLDHEGIAIRGGHHCAMPLMSVLGINDTSRASFYIYNTKNEIDHFIEVLKKCADLFSKKR